MTPEAELVLDGYYNEWFNQTEVTQAWDDFEQGLRAAYFAGYTKGTIDVVVTQAQEDEPPATEEADSGRQTGKVCCSNPARTCTCSITPASA